MTTHGVDRSGAAGGSASGVNAIDETIINAKGDLIVGDGADSVARLAVGTDTYILSALSSEATGLIWLSPADVFQDAVDAATAETAPAIGDFVLLSDVSLTPDNTRKMTLENMLKVVNGLTEDTTPDTDDFLLAYDVSASGVKKVKPENLPLAARKNAIINGDFNVWQRGTSFAGIVAGAYAADRWRYNVAGAAVHTLAQSNAVPTVAQAGRLFNYSLWLDCTTADAAIAASDFTIIGQRIEGQNWLPLAQRPVTLSFWVRATKTGTYCAFLTNDVDRSCVKEFTVDAADTWEKKTLTFPASPSAGTWNYLTGTGVHVGIALAAGSTFQTTADAWQTGVFFATANQVNGTDNTANDFRIAGVQLEAGSVATDFEQRSFNEQLALCQRYYWKTFPYGTVPAQNAGTTGAWWAGCLTAGANLVPLGGIKFPQQMRAAPTLTSYNPSAANAQARNTDSGADCTATTFDATGDQYSRMYCTADAGSQVSHKLAVHIAASAEL